MVTKLPRQVQRTAGISNGLRSAVVTAISAGGNVTLDVNGGDVPAKTVVPVYVGQVVSVMRQDSSWLVLGPPGAVLAHQVGAVSVTFGSTTAAQTVNVSFPSAFAATPTHVSTNIDSGSGPTQNWISRADTFSTTGFRLILLNVTGVATAWSGIPVTWHAVAPT